MQNWLKCDDSPDNLVISSRIRLARNIKNEPFPDSLDANKAREIVNHVEDAFFTSSHINNEFKSIHLWDYDKIYNKSFIEKHLVSNKLIDNKDKSAFIVDSNETVSIMINEEDHIRLQCISSGFNLEEILNYSNKFDDLLEEKIEYAFDEKLGYLTACPTNVGTGLRASVMIHLPVLTMNNQINGVLNALTQVGMTIRGLYGEGSGAYGNLYQISNQTTLGISEEDILSNLKAVVNQLINQEKLSREQALNKYNYELEDKIFRSLGILKSARIMDSKECLKLLSDVRMGVEMGIIKEINKNLLNDLLVNTQSATLSIIYENKLNEKDLNIKRADYIRKKLN
ncbi:putative ATP:guanido phosphotransferase CKL [Clostridium pasteurianum DSM 525 = ATCC 6013]|uniref:Protein-arginine kinase n=1 Tax=Clostridium pasteurianum DSM 525 = ATCC 6013 TaxID=1262449 RepID=A0A0H3JBH9_CLOPA|nr:protein arginine kinase [Clostridium pasteurianum]AJA49760.1 putative ATP:guanido phosphotransferase CKL [Clostridium pasteurianum DSM 525 = ATCC 6013]AJA53748.1 putative ATP:guanido phosphotransferase CKL [Clostridium pasteurianum DSM 525 = ATCC 6013]AOZ76910.1 ATP--guanido phosphotransferase [Clostridium pasteurianum DSM 525 = ATCC 6013]AOZ80707.1 ATP--guanido phosphotransferase [Clostridium pasteurianum]ELP57549.1 ATP:guanido phosphotransferase [Clostridium pasteurianum DSM 525 = ATCC 60